jgi:hypothetical protein
MNGQESLPKGSYQRVLTKETIEALLSKSRQDAKKAQSNFRDKEL